MYTFAAQNSSTYNSTNNTNNVNFDTITQWKQGDLYYWEPHIFHCGANAGVSKKITLNITGIVKKDSLHLSNKKKLISI